MARRLLARARRAACRATTASFSSSLPLLHPRRGDIDIPHREVDEEARTEGGGETRRRDGVGGGVARRAADAGSGGCRGVAGVRARPLRRRHHRALLRRLPPPLQARRVLATPPLIPTPPRNDIVIGALEIPSLIMWHPFLQVGETNN